MEPAIRIDTLGKRYRVSHAGQRSGYRTLRESLVGLATAPVHHWRHRTANRGMEEFWALKDVTCDVQPGEVVGIIGRNGAGKSTLLKILSRITKPTTGEVQIQGRVGSLLEVGTGFHPELTGRENIFMNGSILGMARREIARKFDEIVAFSEIDQFLDTPVKRYSSGMYVRLAFAVAAHLEPEILLVDEVLAVGDVSFQRKCLGKMHSISERGRTVLFVSHNMPAVRSITEKCIYLKDGRVVREGPTSAVIDRYLEDAWGNRPLAGDASSRIDYYRRDQGRDSPVKIRRIWAAGGDGGDPPVLHTGEGVTVHCEFASERAYAKVFIAFWLANQQGERVATFFNADQGFSIAVRKGLQTVTCRVNGLPLSPGRYTITIGISDIIGAVAFDVIVDYPALHVIMPEMESGELEWPYRPWGCLHWDDVQWATEAGR